MTIILPDSYHAKEALKNRNISCIKYERAIRQDIRPLRIGMLNIMPEAKSYEYSLLLPLGRSIIQIEPIWIKLKTHLYKSSDHNYIEKLYMSFERAIANKHLDGLIVTGAPVEEIPYKQVTYWQEVQEILKYARDNIASTLGICWGGLALAKIMGIEKFNYPQKLFGVYEVKNLYPSHVVTGEMDDYFWVPQSRYAGISDDVLELESTRGNINLLAHSKEAGYVIFESTDQKFLMHLGHPEYSAERLVKEYNRDLERGRRDVIQPKNLDLHRPLNRWRGHCMEFFSQWIKFVYLKTSY